MSGYPTSNILDQWEAPASRRVPNPVVACLSNLSSLGGRAMFSAALPRVSCIFSTAAALLLPAGLDVTLSDAAHQLRTETGNDAVQTRDE